MATESTDTLRAIRDGERRRELVSFGRHHVVVLVERPVDEFGLRPAFDSRQLLSVELPFCEKPLALRAPGGPQQIQAKEKYDDADNGGGPGQIAD